VIFKSLSRHRWLSKDNAHDYIEISNPHRTTKKCDLLLKSFHLAVDLDRDYNYDVKQKKNIFNNFSQTFCVLFSINIQTRSLYARQWRHSRTNTSKTARILVRFSYWPQSLYCEQIVLGFSTFSNCLHNSRSYTIGPVKAWN